MPKPLPGGPYTLGKLGAVADVGRDTSSSGFEFVGESGGTEVPASVIRDSWKVRSSDCARLPVERGLWSFSLIFS